MKGDQANGLRKRMGKKKEQVYKFSQTTGGEYFIKDLEGNEVTINVNELTVANLREVLNGLGNLMVGISSVLWNKKFIKIK